MRVYDMAIKASTITHGMSSEALVREVVRRRREHYPENMILMIAARDDEMDSIQERVARIIMWCISLSEARDMLGLKSGISYE